MTSDMLGVLTSGLSPVERDRLLTLCDEENARQVQVAVAAPGRAARPRRSSQTSQPAQGEQPGPTSR